MMTEIRFYRCDNPRGEAVGRGVAVSVAGQPEQQTMDCFTNFVYCRASGTFENDCESIDLASILPTRSGDVAL